MPDISPLVESLQTATGLDLNQAKTIVYWRGGTLSIAQPETKQYPALGLVGASGSGKSTIQAACVTMHPDSCFKVNCEGQTAAATRDQLVEACGKIAIIEEFDQISDNLTAASRYLQARCYRDTAEISYNEPLGRGGYKKQIINLWGGSIYHVRNVPSDAALISRSILIHTKHVDPAPAKDSFSGTPEMFLDLVKGVDWSNLSTGIGLTGRLYDTWSPVLRVAYSLDDKEWLEWAETLIKLLQKRLEGAAEYDHRQVILAKIIEILANRDNQPVDPWGRVAIDAEVGEPLRKELLPHISPWEVADTIKDLGFKTFRKAGKRWLLPEPTGVILACHETRYEDEWVDELKAQMNLMKDWN